MYHDRVGPARSTRPTGVNYRPPGAYDPPVEPSPIGQIQQALDTGRDDAEGILAAARLRAGELSAEASELDRQLIEVRIAKANALLAEISAGREAIGAATVRMAELAAATSARLVDLARQADFSAPPWPDDIGTIVEIKLSQTRRVVEETREVTFRIAADRVRDAEPT